MKWFKHETTALHDAKIEKLIMKYGIEGYGLYFACVEIIAGELNAEHITFELEHDAEVLSSKFKMQQTRVEEIMKFCLELKLFEINSTSNKITCIKLAKRLDVSTSNNPEFKKLLESISDYKKLLPINNRREQKRIEKNRTEQKKIEENRGELKNVLLTELEYNSLITDYGISIISNYINQLSLYDKIDKYLDHNKTIRRWLLKDGIKKISEIPKSQTEYNEFEEFKKQQGIK
jgi:hypothetical protein